MLRCGRDADDRTSASSMAQRQQQVSPDGLIFAFNIRTIHRIPTNLQPYMSSSQWQVFASAVIGARDDCCGGFWGCKPPATRIQLILYQFNNLYFQGSTFFTIDVSGDVYFNPSVLSGFIQGIPQAPRQQVPINFQQQFPFQQPPVGYGESNYGGQQYQNYASPPPGAYPNQQGVSVTPPRGYYGASPSGAYPLQGSNSGALPGAYQQTSYGGDPNSGTHPLGAYSKQDASGHPSYGAPQSKSDAPHSVAPSPSHQLNYAAPAPFNYAFNGPPPNYGAPPSNAAYAEEDAPVVVAVSTQDRVFAFNVRSIRGFPSTLQPYLNNNQWQVLASGVMGARDDFCGGFFGCKSQEQRVRRALIQVNNLYFQGKPFFTNDASGDVYFTPSVIGGVIQVTQSEAPRQQVPINSQQQVSYQQAAPTSPSAPIAYGDPNSGHQYQNYGAPPPGAYPNQQPSGNPNYGAPPPQGSYEASPPGAYPNQGSNPNYGAPQPNYGAPQPNYGAPQSPNYGAPPPTYGGPPPAGGAPPSPTYASAPPSYGAPPPSYGAPPPVAVAAAAAAYEEEEPPMAVVVSSGGATYEEEEHPSSHSHGSAEYTVPEGTLPGTVVKVHAPNGDYVTFTIPDGAFPGAVIAYNY